MDRQIVRRFLLLAVLVLTSVGASAAEVLPFIEDDYARAVAQARKRNLPIFVEAWAPWCHTCRSMKAYVYTDKSLERYAGRFVWLSINTEKASNAAFLAQYPIPVLPTLLVLDPRRDGVAMRYVGGATVPQLRKLLDDSLELAAPKQQKPSDANTLLLSADKLASAGKQAEAAKAYESAIAAAPSNWPRLGRAAESLIFALSMSDQAQRCAEQARTLYPRVKGTVSAANVAATGLSCATSLPDKTLLANLEASTREVFAQHDLDISADDRSGLYIALIEARDASNDAAGAKKLKEEWSLFLEDVASKAKTAEQRAVYDSHRLSAYLDLGTPAKAIPMLEQSERDFPDDYNPPARLTAAYRALKRYDEALAASDRALARVYGPRKLNVLTARSDIQLEKGDKAAAQATLADAITFAKSLPEAQRSNRRIAAMEKKLATISAP